VARWIPLAQQSLATMLAQTAVLTTPLLAVRQLLPTTGREFLAALRHTCSVRAASTSVGMEDALSKCTAPESTVRKPSDPQRNGKCA